MPAVVFAVLLGGLALASSIDGAYGASATITLDALPSYVYEGDRVIFSGMLTGGGAPLPGRTVLVCEDDPFWFDECLVRGTTDGQGRYHLTWTAEAGIVETDFDIYAEFRGDGTYSRDQTPRYTMSVYEVTLPSAVVTLSGIPSRVYAGDTVVFAGTLTGDGAPLAGRTVKICEDDPLLPDECLVRGATDRQGRYHLTWTARADALETDFDIYAEFKGDGSFDEDQTPRYTMSVYKYDGSLVLDPVPSRAAYGEVVTFSGTLRLDAHSPEGAVVYIKDEDSFNPDDLLVSAYVDASGRFTASWIVEDVDPDRTIDIQAVYEGGSLYYRIATSIQDLTAYTGAQQPRPDPDPVGGDGHMELYRSLDFDRPPHVAIVPSPDSYEQVRRHIIPVQEGIHGLTATLEQKYPAGDWNVDFEVVPPGGTFSKRPDVKIDLVTRDDDSDCDWDRYRGGTLGWAFYQAPKPVPTVVCSLDSRTDEDIGATVVHEFVHAIGLGHTFNIPGDLMCSVEDGKETCPGEIPKSTVFSDLNLAALAAIYGTDGFQNPNNDIMREEIFRLGSQNGQVSLQNQGGTATSTPQTVRTAVLYTDFETYRAGEVVLVDGMFLAAYEGEVLDLYLTHPGGDSPAWAPVLVEDGKFAEFFHTADEGTYHMLLEDGDDLVSSVSFDVAGRTDAAIYTDYSYYGPGATILVDGFYWGSYDGPSNIVVYGPDWDVADLIEVDVVGDFFEAYTTGHYVPGRYVVDMYDELDNFVASTAFIMEP